MRLVGLILLAVVVAAPPTASASTRSAGVAMHASATKPCTTFGETWRHRYNAAGGPFKIVAVCCGIRSPKTHASACSVMITGRKGMMGDGMFGCSVATIAASGNVLANKPQA
ncbi:MAG TPA: hypothetical protein VGL76_06720, partial [Gaiellaceae bacterium]